MARMSWSGNTRSNPVWAGDFGGREHIMPFPAKIDPTLFTDQAGVLVQVNAAAAGGATVININALTQAALPATVALAQNNVLIPNGTVIWFGGAKFARLTADALYGATTLTVAALVTALAGTESASYNRYATIGVPSGTPVSRTYANREAGNVLFTPMVTTDDEIFLTYFDVVDLRTNNNVELYRPGSIVKENYLPNYASVLNPGYIGPPSGSVTPAAAGAPSAILIKLRTVYKCIMGVD